MAGPDMQYHHEILMTLYPNGGGEAVDVTIDHNPDPAVAAEIDRIHDHGVPGFPTSARLIEDRMHDSDVRPDLVARRCTCHTPPRVHGIYLIPRTYQEKTRSRPELQSRYHLYFAHAPGTTGTEPLGSHAVETVEHRLLRLYGANALDAAGYLTGSDDRWLPKQAGMSRRRKPDVWAELPGGDLHTFEMQLQHNMTATEAVRLAADHRIAGAATTSFVGPTGNPTLDGFAWRVPIVRTNPNDARNMTPGSRTAIQPARALEWVRDGSRLVPKGGWVTLPNGDPRKFTLDEFLCEQVEGLWVPGTLPDGTVFNMSQADAEALATYVAESAAKPNQGSAWSPILRKHPDAPILPLTAEQGRTVREREERERFEQEQAAQKRAAQKVVERIAERARVERDRADRWGREQEGFRRLAEIERSARERYAAEEEAQRAAAAIAVHEHIADEAGGACAGCGFPWWPAEEQAQPLPRCAQCDGPLLLVLPGRDCCTRCARPGYGGGDDTAERFRFPVPSAWLPPTITERVAEIESRRLRWAAEDAGEADVREATAREEQRRHKAEWPGERIRALMAETGRS